MKFFFIVNPVAGRRKSPVRLIRKIRKICRGEGAEFTIRIWKMPDNLDELIREAKADNYNCVVAVGGDGTVNAIGTRLIGTRCALGIVPSGSGNGYAHHLGFAKKPEQSIRQNLFGRIQKVDTGLFGGIPFLNSAGIGVDAEVAEKFSQSKSRGLRSYIRLSTKAFMNFRSFPVSLEVDGVHLHWKKVFFVDIANGTEWGNGAKISPNSKLSDGLFTSVVVPKAPITKVPALINRLFNGRLDRSKHVKMINGSHFFLHRPNAGVAHVDGDPVYLGADIECELKAESLSVVVPVRKKSV